MRIIDKYKKMLKSSKCPQCGYCFSKNSQKMKLMKSWNKSVSFDNKCPACGLQLKVKLNLISKIIFCIIVCSYLIPLLLVLNKYISHYAFEIISILYILIMAAFDRLYALPTAKIVSNDEFTKEGSGDRKCL